MGLKPDTGAVNLLGSDLGPVGNRVEHFKFPAFPSFRFEYHPEIGKVYLIDLVNAPGVGECIAEHCDTSGRAFGFVQTWLRGFKFGAQIGILKPAIIKE